MRAPVGASRYVNRKKVLVLLLEENSSSGRPTRPESTRGALGQVHVNQKKVLVLLLEEFLQRSTHGLRAREEPWVEFM